ncbi:MAG: hypothetical protein ACI9W1_002890, partial [Candidatus Azotimanducaceae bacterium]
WLDLAEESGVLIAVHEPAEAPPHFTTVSAKNSIEAAKIFEVGRGEADWYKRVAYVLRPCLPKLAIRNW